MYILSNISVHFVKMLALIEGNGRDSFDNLNGNIQKQIEYVYNLVQEDQEYKDIKGFIKKMELANAGSESKEDPKIKAEKSKTLRDKGNKAYSRKEFQDALISFR